MAKILSIHDFPTLLLQGKTYFFRFDAMFVLENDTYEIYFKKKLANSFDEEGNIRKVIMDVSAYNRLNNTIKRLYLSKSEYGVNAYVLLCTEKAAQLKSFIHKRLLGKIATHLNGDKLDIRAKNVFMVSPSNTISQIVSGKVRKNATISNTGERYISESVGTINKREYHRFRILIKFRNVRYSRYININHYATKELAFSEAKKWRDAKVAELKVLASKQV